jgi:hypothetical protein
MRAWLLSLAFWAGVAAGQSEQVRPIGCAEALQYVDAIASAKSGGLGRDETVAALGGALGEYALLMDDAQLRLRLSLVQTLVEMAYATKDDAWVMDAQASFCR